MTDTATPTTCYSPNAQFWIRIIRERLDRYRTELTDAAVLDAIGDVDGHTVLDLGCGEGYMARNLADRGADVVGVDINPELVAAAHAHEQDEPRGIDYVRGSAYDIPIGWRFDLVVMNHLANDLDDLGQALSEVARVLYPGGRVVMLALHPCHYYARSGLAEDDPQWVELYYQLRVREQAFNVAGIESPAPVTAYYRPLEDYFAALAGNGLVVTGFSEPRPAPHLMVDPWWQANFRRPMFMLLTAERR
jgi:SAM-dependent methyltransferase